MGADDREYIIHFRAERHVADPIRALRWLLKAALRFYGVRAVDIRRPMPEGEP